jgi:hypothetical protein
MNDRHKSYKIIVNERTVLCCVVFGFECY